LIDLLFSHGCGGDVILWSRKKLDIAHGNCCIDDEEDILALQKPPLGNCFCFHSCNPRTSHVKPNCNSFLNVEAKSNFSPTTTTTAFLSGMTLDWWSLTFLQ
jgi:hypothetical protein